MLKGVNMHVTIRLEDLPMNIRLRIISYISDAELLTQLAESNNFDIVEAIASNLNTPVSVLEQLAQDECSSVRIAVAANPCTPARALDLLATDKSVNVRINALRNPNTSKETLISQSFSNSMTDIILSNPSLPDEVLQYAIAHIDELDAHSLVAIIENGATPVKILEQLASNQYCSVRVAVAKSERVSAQILTALSMDSEYSVRIAVASNPKTPKSVLTSLTYDEDDNVCYEIARNPSTPARALAKLVSSGRHYWPDVVEAVASNPNTPKTTLDKLSKRFPCYVAGNDGTSEQTFLAIFNNADVSVKKALAKNPSCPANLKDQMLHDDSYEVRLALTRNTHIGPYRLEELANDANPHVRYAAKQRLKAIRQ